jgi:hypothetical protein
MDKTLKNTEKSTIKIKLIRVLNSVTDEHTLIISLVFTVYILAKFNIWIINSYIANSIISFIVIFIICDNVIRLLLNRLIKILKHVEKTTDDTNLSHNITEVKEYG